MAARVLAARAFGPPELSTGRKASGGRIFFHTLGFFQTAGWLRTLLQRGNLSGAFSNLGRVFGRAVSEIAAILPHSGGRRRRRSPSITAIRQTSAKRRTSYASSGADWVHPHAKCRCYSTSQEPEEAGASPPTASLRRQPPWRTRRTASGADEGPCIICSNVGDGADQSHKACLLP